jgi:release factor glutamine methyltransferase
MNIDSIKIKNCSSVYEPREDSYMLAKCVDKRAFGRVLDLGTGTGLQGIVAALNGCDVTFADISQKALDCAKANACMNGVNGGFKCSDLLDSISDKFNTIIFNPPYLPSNDIVHTDLDGGIEGRGLIDRFLKYYKKNVLEEHIILILESAFNHYEEDVKKLDGMIIAKEHYFFEDLVVLMFR